MVELTTIMMIKLKGALTLFFLEKKISFFAYFGNVLIMKRASLQVLALTLFTRIIFVLKTM